jgi:hypothetical protein
MSNVFILLVRNNVFPGVLLTICLISGREAFLLIVCLKSMLGTLFMRLEDLMIGLGWAELHSRLNRNNRRIIRHFICFGEVLALTFLMFSHSLTVNKRQPDSGEVQSELTLNATKGEKVNSGLDSISLKLHYEDRLDTIYLARRLRNLTHVMSINQTVVFVWLDVQFSLMLS